MDDEQLAEVRALLSRVRHELTWEQILLALRERGWNGTWRYNSKNKIVA